jgi:hypothetical protein
MLLPSLPTWDTERVLRVRASTSIAISQSGQYKEIARGLCMLRATPQQLSQRTRCCCRRTCSPGHVFSYACSGVSQLCAGHQGPARGTAGTVDPLAPVALVSGRPGTRVGAHRVDAGVDGACRPVCGAACCAGGRCGLGCRGSRWLGCCLRSLRDRRWRLASCRKLLLLLCGLAVCRSVLAESGRPLNLQGRSASVC